MFERLIDAIDARIGHRKLLHEALDEPIPGGASWAYVFGSGALILFLVQLVTGVVLAMYYSPSATNAWASVAYLEREVTMGAVLRGIHHHGAGGMVIVVALHMLQVVLYGAYKAPREGNWLSGLALLGLVLAFALTGYLLPWDQTGYWATKVATSIAGTVPLVGEILQQLAQGGNDYGNLTLTRFYALHVVVLPLGTLVLIGAHVALFRKHGVTPHPWVARRELEVRVERFWPRQVFYDTVFATAAIVAIVAIAVTSGAPLEAPADPSSNFIARPEWYFLFLFQLLKYFEGPLQVVGTVFLPGLAAAFLAMLPFLDRAPSRSLRKRKLWLGIIAAGLAIVGLLTGLAIDHDAGDTKIAEQKARARREAERARALAAYGVPTAGAAFMMAHDPVTRGERVFERECLSCHALEGRGPDKPKAPDLTGYGSKAWIRQVLRDSDSLRLFGATKVYGMKSFAKLPEADLAKLVEMVFAERLDRPPPIGERPGAALLEQHDCTNCHEFEADESVEGPTLHRYQTRDYIRQIVDDPGQEHLYGADNTMPAFKVRLSDEDREAVVAFLLTLAERAPQTAWPFVDDPGPVPTPRTKPTRTSTTGH